MANTIFENVGIIGMACAVPTTKYVTESYIDLFSEDEVRKFIDMVGVKERYVSSGKQTVSDLCYVAATKLMKSKKIATESIDAVIFVTSTPDYSSPATAFVIHKRLKLKQECIAFDVNLACTGFVYGISIMSSMINSGLIKRGLLLVGTIEKNIGNTSDHTNAMMFGSAGAACIMESKEGRVQSLLKADGTDFNNLAIQGGGARHPLDRDNPDWDSLEPSMNGFEVFRFAITKAPAAWKEFSKLYECSVSDFDYVIFHQANKFMVDHIATKMKLEKDKYPLSIDRFGNTNGASIPVTIVDLFERVELPEKMKLLCIAFGVGLSWGVVSIEIEKDAVLPMIYSDEYDEQAYSIVFGNGKEKEE